MHKREADCTLIFRHWLKTQPQFKTAAFELKQCLTTLPPSALKEHQIAALTAASSAAGLLYKISDESRGLKPFDMFLLREVNAYVVVFFRTARTFVGVPVAKFVQIRQSRTLARLIPIAAFTVPY